MEGCESLNKKILRYVMIFSLAFLSGCGSTKAVVEEKQKYEENSVPGEKETGDEPAAQDSVPGTVSSGDAPAAEDRGDAPAAEDRPDDTGRAEIRVYVCGAVRKEGVYSLSADAIVDDALRAAGGYTEGAGHGYVNLAAPVSDGMRIYFPTEAEMDEAAVPGSDRLMTDGSNADRNMGDAGPDQTGSSGGGLININTAGREELMKLPGIGESKADDIIKYREEHGKFESIDDIKKINGIKEGVFEKIRHLITV